MQYASLMVPLEAPMRALSAALVHMEAVDLRAEGRNRWNEANQLKVSACIPAGYTHTLMQGLLDK